MYKMILVPVDLEHADQLDKALTITADLAKLYDASVCAVGVTASTPSSVAHNPAEFAQKLEAFAAEQSTKRGVQFAAKAVTTPDPTIDVDAAVRRAATELSADLVVMASHVPGFREYFIGSNAGYLASHADISVLVVR